MKERKGYCFFIFREQTEETLLGLLEETCNKLDLAAAI
jgi:hypothetical protein